MWIQLNQTLGKAVASSGLLGAASLPSQQSMMLAGTGLTWLFELYYQGGYQKLKPEHLCTLLLTPNHLIRHQHKGSFEHFRLFKTLVLSTSAATLTTHP